MTTSRTIALQDRQSGAFVRAELVERVDTAYARRSDDSWLTFLAAEIARAQASARPLPEVEHAHWRWENKVANTGHLLSYPTLGIDCDGDVQGLMLLRTDGEFGRLPEQLNHPLVYVVFLATAPWNLLTIAAKPRFKGVGTVLLRTAAEISGDLGFKGRIGLHALPQSETFYRRSGMTCLGVDPDKEGLNYFEMNVAAAATFVR